MMDTTITFTVGELLTWVLTAAGIIALIFLIVLLARLSNSIRNMDVTMLKVNTLLDDVNIIVKDAKEMTGETKTALKKASASVNTVCKIIDDNKNPITAITNLANAGASLASILGLGKKKK